ncbi:arsenic metallochaperone ArsD family protein [Chryseobacterium sp. JK1]|uniref:arsenic metallochaperone ArsD family protein n=1 Tax=Chryseobacterium sp. JK1 TaxID=874294 RepID=UPI003D683CBF
MNTQYTVTVFEIGGCCSTSLMDPAHYSELNELEQLTRELKLSGISLIRINAALKPHLLNAVPKIDDYLQDKGMEIFPLTVVQGKIVKEQKYPTRVEIDEWLNMNTTKNNQNKK